MSIYLDYNASAPINESVLEKMISVYRTYIGNADSRTHDFGNGAREVVEHARGQVASLLGVKNDEVFFTSGATESNNIVIQGLREYGISKNKKHIVVSAIEHKAVLETAKAMRQYGFEIDIVYPDEQGIVTVERIKKTLRDDTLLVCLMHVNNETGVIQPVKAVGNMLSEKNILFHVDATQSCGKLVDELRELKYDTLSLSAHKLGGPQGIGALIMRKKRYKLPPVKPIMYGGGQEKGIRPGTLPIALIAGLGQACEMAQDQYEVWLKKCINIKKCVLKLLKESKVDYEINGDPQYCMPTTINIRLKGVNSEALMLATKEVCAVSNGSACNSRSYSPSYVLASMGLAEERIEESLRISWGAESDVKKLENGLKELLSVAAQLAK